MKNAAFFTKPSLWSKVFIAAVLSLCLMSSTVQAAELEDRGESPKATELNTENANAFLDKFFATEQVQPYYVGASVVIVKDGKVVTQKGYGYSDVEQGVKVDPASTVFRIASVSKTFNAVAIMQLVEQGEIDLEADFQKYIADLPFENPFDTPVTIEHLLTHTTGFEIRDPQPEDLHTDFDKIVEIEDYVRAHMPPVVREPGSSYMYDNFASLMLGLIVQNVSGMPYEEYMDKYIFGPLDMNNSGFRLGGELLENLATGYDAVNQPMELYTLSPTIMPHGGMLSTAEDVGKFMISFLNEGATASQPILTKESVALMEPYRSSIHPLLPNTTYGFEAPPQIPGAGSSDAIITKLGDLNGFSSHLILIPEQNTGIFLTYSKTGPLRNIFYPQFIATFFPQYAAPAELAEFEPQSAEELARFSGYYADLRLGALVSSLDSTEDGNLMISDAFLGPRVLYQVDENLFVDQLTNQFTAFQLDENGEASYIKEPYLNPLGYAGKGAVPAGFVDVDESHPYAKYIMFFQSLGYYANDNQESFSPEQHVTRGEYVEQLLEISNISGSQTEELAFTDIAEHDSAAYVQMAYELGMVQGNGHNQFNPDRDITRQEAAVMIWRLLAAQYPAELFDSVPLAGTTDEWAVPAVQMMITLGIHGPEVQLMEDGSIDFQSKKVLNRQEEAAILFALFTQPTDQIVAALMQQSAAQ